MMASHFSVDSILLYKDMNKQINGGKSGEINSSALFFMCEGKISCTKDGKGRNFPELNIDNKCTYK